MKKISFIVVKNVSESLGQIIVIIAIAVVLWGLLMSCETEYPYLAKQKSVEPLPFTVLSQTNNQEGMNIVFVPERYGLDELESFRQEVNMALNLLKATAPFSYSMDKLNIYACEIPSPTDSTSVFGMPKPEKLQVNAPVRCDSIQSVMRRLPFENEETVLVIMTNEKEAYLGYTLMTNPMGKMAMPQTVVIQDLTSYEPAVLIHELGHACGLLADSYNTQGTAIGEEECIELRDYQSKGMFLNVTTNQDSLSWQMFIDDKDNAADQIGLYEGGYGFEKSIWRPTINSVMRYHYIDPYYSKVEKYYIYRNIVKMYDGREVSYEEWKTIDLHNPQKPIDFAKITGNSKTRSAVAPIRDYDYNDVIIDPCDEYPFPLFTK